MNKIKLQFTKAQFLAMLNLVDTLDAMRGCADYEWELKINKNLRLFNRMMKFNGYKKLLNEVKR